MEQLVRLKEQFQALRNETDRRHESNTVESNRRHLEIVTRLDRIDGNIGKAHERVSALEGIVGYLKEEWVLIRRRYHELVNWRQTNEQGGGDNSIVRRMDVKMALAIYVGGIATVTAILKMIGKI